MMMTPATPAPQPGLDMIVLAAGLGTRMKSDLPKVLHPICGQPMLALLLEELDRAVASVLGARFNIVVGHGREKVIEMVEGLKRAGRIQVPVLFTVQDQQLGTGHAVKLALAQRSAAGTVAVFNGDLPLFSTEAFTEFLSAHLAYRSTASAASAMLEDAGQYGRVLRGKRSEFLGVVEYKDASPAQRKIGEFNGGVYLFDRAFLLAAMGRIKNKNASGEFYLPDVFALARKLKKKIMAYRFADPRVLSGVNTMRELALAQKALYLQTAEKHLSEGVFLAEPEHTYIGPRVSLGRGCVIGPFTAIGGESRLADRVRVGAHCELSDVTVGEGTVIRNATVAEKSAIGKECSIGPMAHLRPGSRLADHVKVGNFVELKESSMGSHSSAAHLSYVGDAEIGARVNLGCGFVTCNYDGTVRDGRRKHRTVVGDDVFVGSDSQLVAPIQIADGTFIASGSTVTQSVPEKESLVIARTRQVTKPGYAKKYKKG